MLRRGESARRGIWNDGMFIECFNQPEYGTRALIVLMLRFIFTRPNSSEGKHKPAQAQGKRKIFILVLVFGLVLLLALTTFSR